MITFRLIGEAVHDIRFNEGLDELKTALIDLCRRQPNDETLYVLETMNNESSYAAWSRDDGCLHEPILIALTNPRNRDFLYKGLPLCHEEPYVLRQRCSNCLNVIWGTPGLEIGNEIFCDQDCAQDFSENEHYRLRPIHDFTAHQETQ